MNRVVVAALTFLLSGYGCVADQTTTEDERWSMDDTTAEAARLPSASRVCVDNRAGFVLSFEMWDTATNLVSRRSISYPTPGQSCLDMWTVQGIDEGHPIVTVVYAAGGTSQSLPPMTYTLASSGEEATASFTCSGSTFLFSCALGGVVQTLQPGPLVVSPSSPQSKLVQASGICVVNSGAFRMKARLWDTSTGVVGAWSEGFNHGDVVCLHADALEIKSGGDPFVLITYTQGGKGMSFRSVAYDSEAELASFACKGSTVVYECQLLGSTRRLPSLI
jgi:hypothetical protein